MQAIIGASVLATLVGALKRRASEEDPATSASDSKCTYDESTLSDYISCQKASFSTTTLIIAGCSAAGGVFLLSFVCMFCFHRQNQRRKAQGDAEGGDNGEHREHNSDQENAEAREKKSDKARKDETDQEELEDTSSDDDDDDRKPRPKKSAREVSKLAARESVYNRSHRESSATVSSYYQSSDSRQGSFIPPALTATRQSVTKPFPALGRDRPREHRTEWRTDRPKMKRTDVELDPPHRSQREYRDSDTSTSITRDRRLDKERSDKRKRERMASGGSSGMI